MKLNPTRLTRRQPVMWLTAAKRACVVGGWAVLTASLCAAQDWNQFQHDSASQGRAPEPVEPPFQLRWVWYGPGNVVAGGRPLPEGKVPRPPTDTTAKLSFTMHAVVADRRVFFGDLKGRVVGLDSRTGDEIWMRRLPGALVHAFGVLKDRDPEEHVVIVPCQDGTVYGLRWSNGNTLWRVRGDGPFVTPVKLHRGIAYIGGMDGVMRAIDGRHGDVKWEYHAGAPIRQACAIAGGRVFFGSEDMVFHALDAATGHRLWRTGKGQFSGQSFRNTWPVVVDDKVMTFQVLVDGQSEFVMETLLFNATPGDHRNKRLEDWPVEREAILAWLAGDMTWAADCQKSWQDNPGQVRGGRSMNFAGTRMRKTLYVFDCQGDGQGRAVEPYQVPMGVVGGTGNANMGPTLDARGRPLLWWRVSARSIMTGSGFGTAFCPDISAMNITTGDRIILPTTRDIHAGGPGMELDNHHMLTAAGDYVYYFNPFRQARWIRLDGQLNPSGRISSAYRRHDGGGWPADVVYYPSKQDAGQRALHMFDSHGAARTPLVIADGALLANEIDIRAMACYESRGAKSSSVAVRPKPMVDPPSAPISRGRQPVGDAPPNESAYLWQKLTVTHIPDRGEAERLRRILTRHIGDMVAEGHLRPYYVKRGENNPRWYFTNPGDMIMALCGAYAHLPVDLQRRVGEYLGREMASYPPLGDTITTPGDEGASRMDFDVPDHLRGFDARFYRQLPRAHNLYAVWLYVDTTGDRAYVARHWNEIRAFAEQHHSDFNIYMGGAAGAIGWARLAAIAGDEKARMTAERRAHEALAAIRDESKRRDAMCERYGFGRPWHASFCPREFHLLHLVPEVARYVRHHPDVCHAVLQRMLAAVEQWPMWSISQASAFTRYYGESHALSPIVSKMIFPTRAMIERAAPARLAVWAVANDAPRGDLFFIERLVLAIESYGRYEWTGVTHP